MARNRKQKNPLPKSFDTLEEFVEFWDTHSTADYPEAFREIHEPVRLLERWHYRVALDERISKQLAQQARSKGVTLEKLVNQLLSEHLRRSA